MPRDYDPVELAEEESGGVVDTAPDGLKGEEEAEAGGYELDGGGDGGYNDGYDVGYDD